MQEYFTSVDIETYQAIRELLHSEAQLKNVVTENQGKERIDMCTAIEAIYNDGLNEGIEEGKWQQLLELVKKKFAKGLSMEEIADALEQSVETIEKLIKEL